MGIYLCGKCGKKFKSEELDLQSIRCSYCGNKVLFKQTPPVLKKVSTD